MKYLLSLKAIDSDFHTVMMAAFIPDIDDGMNIDGYQFKVTNRNFVVSKVGSLIRVELDIMKIVDGKPLPESPL